jgi:hypothetical protein
MRVLVPKTTPHFGYGTRNLSRRIIMGATYLLFPHFDTVVCLWDPSIDTYRADLSRLDGVV